MKIFKLLLLSIAFLSFIPKNKYGIRNIYFFSKANSRGIIMKSEVGQNSKLSYTNSFYIETSQKIIWDSVQFGKKFFALNQTEIKKNKTDIGKDLYTNKNIFINTKLPLQLVRFTDTEIIFENKTYSFILFGRKNEKNIKYKFTCKNRVLMFDLVP